MLFSLKQEAPASVGGGTFTAYVFLYAKVLVSLPGAFIFVYYELGDTVRLVGGHISSGVVHGVYGKIDFLLSFS